MSGSDCLKVFIYGEIFTFIGSAFSMYFTPLLFFPILTFGEIITILLTLITIGMERN